MLCNYILDHTGPTGYAIIHVMRLYDQRVMEGRRTLRNSHAWISKVSKRRVSEHENKHDRLWYYIMQADGPEYSTFVRYWAVLCVCILWYYIIDYVYYFWCTHTHVHIRHTYIHTTSALRYDSIRSARLRPRGAAGCAPCAVRKVPALAWMGRKG